MPPIFSISDFFFFLSNHMPKFVEKDSFSVVFSLIPLSPNKSDMSGHHKSINRTTNQENKKRI